jgi:hypothetical protein
VGLTGKSAAENVNWFQTVVAAGRAPHRVNASDIFVAPHVGPVLRQHRPTPRIQFHLPANVESCTTETKVKPANAGE